MEKSKPCQKQRWLGIKRLFQFQSFTGGKAKLEIAVIS